MSERYSEDATFQASWLDFDQDDILKSRRIHHAFIDELDIQSVSWFLPHFEHPYYGGLYSILRFADYFRERKEVRNQFVIVGSTLSESRIRQSIASAFPKLADERIQLVNNYQDLLHLQNTDVGIATFWFTAFHLLKFNATKRKFYFVQDYEPLFYPAGTSSGLVEATYRFGFLGIANTITIKNIYEIDYDGVATYFTPCVDTELFHPTTKKQSSTEPFQVFFYGRPNHERNAFELGAATLRRLKQRLGEHVRIVSAGAAWLPKDLDLEGVVENLGLLDYRETAALYRTCDVGLTMMFTRHPSYLPFEFMASGCLVVSNHNNATKWLLKDRENCLLSEPSVSCLADTLEHALLDAQERQQITTNALAGIEQFYSNWDGQMEKVFAFMCDPLANCL